MGLKDFLFAKAPENSSELAGFYAGKISRWDEIYCGGGDWRYTRKGGLNGGTRRVAAMNAAKAVCAELSRLCFSEGTELVSADKQTQEFLDKVLRENDFAQRFPDFLERVFALGGGVIKVFWDGGVKLDFVSADCFVPTSWDGDSISGGAFGSRVFKNGKSWILAETQELTDEGFVTENRLFTADGRRAELSEAFANLSQRSVITGLEKPLFVYLRAAAGGDSRCPVLGE
ncbi:MAG: hypothetical protein ACI4Q4_09250, partial [Oscillospiraceae bacterium]